MKIYKILFTLIMCFALCACQNEETEYIEITQHVYVEKEFVDSWLEKCDNGKSYLQLVLDGGYVYVTNKEYLELFYQDGGRIELYNYSLIQDDMIISGEFIPDKTIRLVHPNLEHIASEGVLMHELGHYFDYRYHLSEKETFQKWYKQYIDGDIDIDFQGVQINNAEEFFAEIFKLYTGEVIELPDAFQDEMEQICRKILENK